mmetsp:Transcript_35776/g.64904  ORF Transcript_35776/g.64904 Transcript_35776/m.64904 type:complete len:1421 (+) Transcript_35776:57-4319(+)
MEDSSHRLTLAFPLLSLEEQHDLVVQALAEPRLFAGCGEAMIDNIAQEATLQYVPPSQDLQLSDEIPMLIVLQGAVSVSVGNSHEVSLGVRSVVNVAGMLGLYEAAEQFKPRGARGFDEASRGTVIWKEDEEGMEMSHLDIACLTNLCPHLSLQHAAGSVGQRSGWVSMNVKADKTSGATFAAVPFDVVKRYMTPLFERNMQRLIDNYFHIMRHSVLPGAPPEVAWAAANVAESLDFKAGQILVEADSLEDPDSLIVIESGTADVERRLYPTAGADAEPKVLGHLGPGAIIGDICFLNAQVPRAATVRARSNVKALKLPPGGLLEVLRTFPGTTACFGARLRDTTALLQESLARPADMLSKLHFFAECDRGFLRAVGSICERRVCLCGEVIKEESSTDDTLRVMEFGQVRVEKKDAGFSALTGVDTVLGERRFFGLPVTRASASFTVATPLTMILVIRKQSFISLLDNYPNEQKHLRQLHEFQTTDSGNAKREHLSAHLPILENCSSEFIAAITGSIRTVTFKPKQTILEQNAVDAGSMYILKGGQANISVNGQVVKQVFSGESFGELAILGFVTRRSASVWATRLCHCLEILRAAFVEALAEHPEEQERFEELSKQHGVHVKSTKWPMFEHAPSTFLSLLNLYARRQVLANGEWISTSSEPLPVDAAVMVFRGEIHMTTESGEKKVITEGQCFNEQVLLGLPVKPGTETMKPFNCEAQILTQDIFKKIVIECANHEQLEQAIKNEMAVKAEEELGFSRGGWNVLKFSGLFRAGSSENFLLSLRSKLDACLYQPGEIMFEQKQPGFHMFFLIQGTAVNEGDGQMKGPKPQILSPGEVFGEALILGSDNSYCNTLRAQSACMTQALSRVAFSEALEEFPEEKAKYDHLLKASPKLDLPSLLKRQSKAFNDASIEFINIVCHLADDIFFAPGEEIMTHGQASKLGETCMYVLLSGSANVQAEFGDELAKLKSGDVIGEGGALGISDFRAATVKVFTDDIAHCVRLHGLSIEYATQVFPDEFEAMTRIYDQRTHANLDAERSRKLWLQDSVIPALLQCRIFKGFPLNIVHDIAEQLLQTTYEKGQTICQVGQSADSMIVLLQGKAELRSHEGDLVGHLTDGAVIGETAVLGVYPWRTAGIRTVRKSHVVFVPASLIFKILEAPGARSAREAFLQLEASRRQQVEQGWPLTCLPLQVNPQDICVRAIALHADHFNFATGDMWSSSQCREHHFWIFVKGKAILTIGHREILLLSPESSQLLPEASLVEYEASFTARTTCKAYRLNVSDVLLATNNSRLKWFKDFEQQIKDSSERIRQKLQGAKMIGRMQKQNRSLSKGSISSTGSYTSQMKIAYAPDQIYESHWLWPSKTSSPVVNHTASQPKLLSAPFQSWKTPSSQNRRRANTSDVQTKSEMPRRQGPTKAWE